MWIRILAVLRIRDVLSRIHPGSGIFIPDQEFSSRIQGQKDSAGIKKSKYY
jgi:hypothetical protein